MKNKPPATKPKPESIPSTTSAASGISAAIPTITALAKSSSTMGSNSKPGSPAQTNSKPASPAARAVPNRPSPANTPPLRSHSPLQRITSGPTKPTSERAVSKKGLSVTIPGISSGLSTSANSSDNESVKSAASVIYREVSWTNFDLGLKVVTLTLEQFLYSTLKMGFFSLVALTCEVRRWLLRYICWQSKF